MIIIGCFRSDRERCFLSTKVKNLQKQLTEGAESSHHEGKVLGDNRVCELERVISAMKKVIEKLQTENDNQKKILSANSKPPQAKLEGGKKLVVLQEENSKLKVRTNYMYKQVSLSLKCNIDGG